MRDRPASITAAAVAVAVLCSRPAAGGWQTFTTRDGLGKNYVGSLLEDHLGRLCFRIEDGVSVYDGARWRTFSNSDLTFSALDEPMLEDRDGNLWFGTAGPAPPGVVRLSGSNWRTFTTADGLTSNSVRPVLQDRAGNMWFIGDGNGANRYDGSSWRTFTMADGLLNQSITTMMEDHTGNLWFGHAQNGVTRFDGSNWRTFTSVDGIATRQVTKILEDQSGHMWVTTLGGGVSRYDGTGWHTWTVADGLADDHVYDGSEDSTGNLWFLTTGGLSRYDGSTWQSVPYPAGIQLLTRVGQPFLVDQSGRVWLTDSRRNVYRYDGFKWQTITSADGFILSNTVGIREDRSGNLWFATRVGVSRYDRSSWRTFTTADGLASNVVTTLLADHSSRSWFGTSIRGVSRFDGINWRTYTTADGLASDTIRVCVEDSKGVIWFGGAGGVSRYDGTSWRAFTTADGLASNDIHDILEDHGGNLWFTTDDGVSRFDGSSWRTFTTADGLGSNVVWTGLEDRNGILWFGTSHGVSRFDGAAWRTFTKADGLAADTVAIFVVDRNANLWCGAGGVLGVNRYDGSTWTKFTAANGLADNIISTMLADRAGNVWISTQNGVSRFDGTRWTTLDDAGFFVRRIKEDRAGNLWFGSYSGVTRYDGIRWVQATPNEGISAGSVFRGIVEDATGNLWFATNAGVRRYELDVVPPRTVLLVRPPRVSPSTDQHVTFAAAFGEANIEFATRFDGGSWSDWSTSRSWFGSGLSDGTHLIEVRSRDIWHNVEQEPASITVEIDATPPHPVIAAPAFGQPVRGGIEIRGSTTDIRFDSYRVQVKPSAVSSWNAPEATLLAESTAPVSNGALAGWDTRPFPDGSYDILVSVSDSLGLTGSTELKIIVDNVAPFADQTTPARILAATGGDVYAPNAEAHLYFPPHAFDDDALVTVEPLRDDAPVAFVPGAASGFHAYEIAWAGTLRKPARLTLNSGESEAAPGDLAVYRSTDGANWERLGGTFDAGRKSLSLSITRSGRYTLLADSRVEPPGSSLSPISFTPRVFSPTGSFADRQLGISFRLGREAPVTVKIWSPSGRLIREVASDVGLNAGENLIPWDGTDRNGVKVVDGLYFVTVEALGHTEKKALAVVK